MYSEPRMKRWRRRRCRRKGAEGEAEGRFRGGGGKSGGSGGNGGGGRTPKGLEVLLGKAKKGADKKVKEIPIQLATLITTIYEAKIKQDQDDALEGRLLQSLPEFARLLDSQVRYQVTCDEVHAESGVMCRGKGSTALASAVLWPVCHSDRHGHRRRQRGASVLDHKGALFMS